MSQYKDGTVIPDAHVARLMIALLMGGQHNTAASARLGYTESRQQAASHSGAVPGAGRCAWTTTAAADVGKHPKADPLRTSDQGDAAASFSDSQHYAAGY